MSEDKKLPSVEEVLEEFRVLKGRIGGIQKYLAGLHAEEEGRAGSVESEEPEETYITYSRAEEVLHITQMITEQLKIMHNFSDHEIQMDVSKTSARVIKVHSRILDHLEK
jgi:hypothetical protein